MYTKILAQGTKFGSGATGLDHPDLQNLVKYEYIPWGPLLVGQGGFAPINFKNSLVTFQSDA